MKLYLLVALICTATGLVVAADSVSPKDLLLQAQTLDRSLQASQALEVYQRAEVLEPNRVEILLGIARQYRHLMADASGNAEKLRLLTESLNYSKRAVKLAPDSADAHLALAITYAKMVALQGTKDKIATSRLLRKELDVTLKLDSRSDLAWHLLGRLSESYAEISSARRAMGELLYGSLPTGTYEEAARYLQKAIAENPSRLMHYIELGRVYGLMGRTDEARALLKNGLAMPNREKDDPVYKLRGKEALAKLP